MLKTGFDLRSAKLFYILLFLFVTSPTSSHALAQAAISVGLVPEGADWRKKRPADKNDKTPEPPQ
jgi:multicomponent Na+:H+ antiporter subunit G